LEGSGASGTDNTADQTNVGSSKSETTSTSSSSTEKKNNTTNTSNTVEKKQNTSSPKNEQAEAAKKALQYINGERTYENHQKAYEWALKADAATKAKVLQRLKDMDFPIP
jgi:UV DNA damage repair endonuclease